ncbi:MAG: transcription termination/antitermination NusG family protein [Bacteroidota bacterium]
MALTSANSRKLSTIDRLDEHEARWFALKTANRHEKIALRLLERDGVECYLPLQEVKRTYQRKVVNRKIPLLPCYVFINIVRKQERLVFSNPYANFLRVGGNRIDVSPEEIEMMKRVAGDENVDWEVMDAGDWMEGQSVELVGGIYTGWQGTFVKMENKGKFVVRIQGILDKVFVATVDGKYIQPKPQ